MNHFHWEGSYGTRFYIILTGSVRILANLYSIYEELSPSGQISQKKEVQLTEVKVAKAGESFGELALLDNKPRAATIITREETCLAVLEKEYYDQILSKPRCFDNFNGIRGNGDEEVLR